MDDNLKSQQVMSLVPAKVLVAVAVLILVTTPVRAVGVQGGGVPEFDHVFLYMLENRSFGQISGNPDAQFLNGPQPEG